MASKAQLENLLRNDFLAKVCSMVDENYETDALAVSASELAIPVLDAEGNEKFILVKVSIPRGTRNGEGGYTPYDGYEAHDAYLAEQESKAQEKAVKKAMKAAEKGKKKTKEEIISDLTHEDGYTTETHFLS